MRVLLALITAILMLASCIAPPPSPENLALDKALTPTIGATPDVFYVSNDGGDPRSTAYWLEWNTCAEGNKSETARANGGREAGWLLVDDLVEDPGIALGDLAVRDCQQAVRLLKAQDAQQKDRSVDQAYALAAQLLAAELNLTAGSEFCPAVDDAVRAGHLLLSSLAFDATQGYLGPPTGGGDVETARILVDQLSQYNTGQLCVP